MSFISIKISSREILPKKVCAIHDLSCIGRCALTVVIPILSQMGVQVIPLPTALLSSHTGGYTDFSFLELTDEMVKIDRHFARLGTKFDCVYSGFLGDESQINFVLDFAKRCKRESGALFFADPVMGDDGEKYQTYTDKMCTLTKEIAKEADVITPNLTEACILLDIPYRTNFSDAELRDMLDALSLGGSKDVVITGITQNENSRMGAVYFDKENRAFGNHFTEMLGVSYPGTGEAFACVLLGSLLRGVCLGESVYSAVSYVFSAVNLTHKMGTPVREGILLESLSIE